MDIQPKYLDLATLLHRRLFRIPQYQRAYSWRPKHRKDLFDDIRRSWQSENGGSHFMATIVGLRQDRVKIITNEYQFVDIVDGQQRITTLILLFKAIAKALDCSDSDDERIRRDIEEVLVKPDRTSLLLLQTNHESSNYFANYFRSGEYPNPGTARTLADRELLKAIEECEGFVSEWRDEGWSLPELVSHLNNRLTFILHEISDESLVYTVFEVLNSRGLDVSWFDRLKSMLMAVVFEAETGNRSEIIDEIHQLWSDIYGTIGLRLGLSTESLRFAATLRREDCPNRLPSEEDAAILLLEQSQSPLKVVDTTKWIKLVTEAVDSLAADVRRNAVTRIAHTRLVAAAVNLRPDLTERKRTQILRRWENVTFRIFGMSGKDARTGVGAYVRLAWRIVQERPNANQIMDDLSKVGRHFPIKKAVKKLGKSDCYNGWQEELRYFFRRYEEYLERQNRQRFDNEQWSRIWEASAARSIEHILPQSSGRKYVHWLGNLSMLPPNLNSELQDLEPIDKVDRYNETGLRIACNVATRITGASRWTRSEANSREKDLIAWAKKEWAD